MLKYVSHEKRVDGQDQRACWEVYSRGSCRLSQQHDGKQYAVSWFKE